MILIIQVVMAVSFGVTNYIKLSAQYLLGKDRSAVGLNGILIMIVEAHTLSVIVMLMLIKKYTRDLVQRNLDTIKPEKNPVMLIDKGTKAAIITENTTGNKLN